MKIRDLKEYISSLCEGKLTSDLLGTNDEVFLKKMGGMMKKVDSVITGAASFASNAEEQLFYEFVQNAYDANADTLCFFMDENYLIVLNNGEPFYTDFNINENSRDGQLYSFLAKGQSLKDSDDDKLGKYGQGSKLLYTLLADVDYNRKTEDLLLEAIHTNKKGPYLISWNDKVQLSNLLLNDGQWEYSSADDEVNNLLFAKIVMSYYPIAPGQCDDFFTKEEVFKALCAFDNLVNPRRNMHYMSRGSALIVPLGSGKYDIISSVNNINNVKLRLGGFASITANKIMNRGKKLEHIYVLNEEIEQHKTESLFVCDSNYHFIFCSEFANKNYVNFFKGLPILQTKYSFGFILDSQSFEVDDSRQRISDTDKTKYQLNEAFTALIEELEMLKAENKSVYDFIYYSLLSSKLFRDTFPEDGKYAREAFYSIFRPYFKSNVLTSLGTYVSYECVFEPDDSLGFDLVLSDLGINNKFWVNDKIASLINRHYSSSIINKYSFLSILGDADKEMLKSWILALSKDDYFKFFKLCVKNIEEIKDLCVFKTTNNRLVSYNELISNENIYYHVTDVNCQFPGQEQIVETLSSIINSDYYSILYQKVINNLESLKESNLGVETAANILKLVYDSKPEYRNAILSNVRLLKNFYGEYTPFIDLINKRPFESVIFDKFRIQGFLPDSIKDANFYADSYTEKNINLWKWVVRNLDKLIKVEGWGELSDNYLEDIIRIYDDNKNLFDCEPISLYLDDDGIPKEPPVFKLSNYSKISSDEYLKIKSYYPDSNLVSSRYISKLSMAPFNLPELSVSDLIMDGDVVDFDFIRICNLLDNDLFSHYIIKEVNDNFEIKYISQAKNYINDLSSHPKLVDELESHGFYKIPQLLLSLVQENNRFNYDFRKNTHLVNKLIDKFSADAILLLPIIRECDASIISNFIKTVGTIDITDKLEVDSVIWEYIKFSVLDDDRKDIVFNNLRFKGNELPSEIRANQLSYLDVEYDLYQLIKEYEDDNKLIDEFLALLPSKSEIQWFKENFYSGKTNNISPKDIYEYLYNTYLTIYQLRFCLIYSIKTNQEYYELETNDQVKLLDALNMIESYNILGFDKYYKMTNFDSDIQIYASSELLIEEEVLPEIIYNWINKNTERLELFRCLKSDDNPYIRLRRSLLYGDLSITDISFIKSSVLLNNTIEWLLEKQIEYTYKSASYNLISKFINEVFDDYNLFLRYTGHVEVMQDKPEVINPVFILENYQDNSYFLYFNQWQSFFLESLKNKQNIRDVFKDNIIFFYESENELKLLRDMDNISEVIINIESSEGDYTPLDIPLYEKWRSLSKSKGIEILLSNMPISIKFKLQVKDTILYVDDLKNNDFGYVVNKRVVVRYPNKYNLPPLKMIEKYISEMEFFKEPFIALLGLYVDSTDGNISNDEGAIYLNEDSNLEKSKVQDVIRKLDDKVLCDFDNLKELSELLNDDELDRLISEKDKLLKLLNDDEGESKVNAIIGLIGEYIYSYYLKSKNKEFSHDSLEKQVGEYDFYNKTDDVYVDVKTNLYSLKDGTAPFYLHRSQNKFMQEHPNSKYRIVRISLNDLSLESSYRKLRDKYEKGTDPFINPRLMKDCEKTAKKFWQGASIEEFDENSPEYAIRIEKK